MIAIVSTASPHEISVFARFTRDKYEPLSAIAEKLRKFDRLNKCICNIIYSTEHTVAHELIPGQDAVP